jgi:pyrroline-5-carboxylate reductase
MHATIGFVGAGNFSEAMIRGLRAAGIEGSRILVTTRRRAERLEHLRRSWGVVPARDKAELGARASTIILAMKPQDRDQAMTELRPHVSTAHLFISVMAGVPCAAVEQHVAGAPVVRAMPNLPMAVMAGSTSLAHGRHATAEHRAAARALFDLVGHTVEVPEGAMDIVTAVAGSGPAYVYLFMEALIAAGAEAGLDPEAACDLAVHTVYGAGKLIRDTGIDPGDLRRRVTSPGGTTQAAMTVFEARAFTTTIKEAVRAAIQRGKELGA